VKVIITYLNGDPKEGRGEKNQGEKQKKRKIEKGEKGCLLVNTTSHPQQHKTPWKKAFWTG